MEDWLKEHKFEFSEVTQEWSRTLAVMGNFKKDDGTFEQRKIQTLDIIVQVIDEGELKGYGARLVQQNGYDLDNADTYIYNHASNVKLHFGKTPMEAIQNASNSLCGKLISSLKQAAKIASKTLKIEFAEEQK